MSVATQAIQALIDSDFAWSGIDEDGGYANEPEYCSGKEAGLDAALEAVQEAEKADLEERSKRFWGELKRRESQINYNDI